MAGPARYRLISCNVFQRELSLALAQSTNIIDVEFLELGLHENSGRLNEMVQARIDAADVAKAPGGEPYDAILLGYGLCGNGIAGIHARSLPLVIARAHDCCTILLGSRAEFLARFGENLSASWSSVGYIERGSTYFRASEIGHATGIGTDYQSLVEQYGEENAAFVWETLHPKIEEKELRYVEVPETSGLGHAETMRARAAAEGKEFILIPGNMRLLRGLVAGGWDETEYLIVPPGKHVEPTWDHDRVFEAKPEA
jgi:hypothetical protein